MQRFDDDTFEFLGRAAPDMRNFEGSLPLRLDLQARHFAFLDVDIRLNSDGSIAGGFAPRVVYTETPDEVTPWSEPIGAAGYWGHVEAPATPPPLPDGDDATLSGYPGSAQPPLADISLRVDAVEPRVDVEVTATVDGNVVEKGTIEPGYIELGELPYGTRISLEGKNINGAGGIRTLVVQDNCFVRSDRCIGQDCGARVDYIVGYNGCVD